MGLFRIVYWWFAALGSNSRFRRINSRLGRRKFPVSRVTGIGSQDIDLLCDFLGRTAQITGKSKKFPVPREKPGTGSLLSGRRAEAAIGARLRDVPIAEPNQT